MPTFPRTRVDYCLKQAGVTLADVDYVAFYDKPFLKFERLLETYLAFAPRGFQSFRMAMPLWLQARSCSRSRCCADELQRARAELRLGQAAAVLRASLSHAASAFYPSPFERGGGAHDGRRRRMGDDVGRRSARAISSRCSKEIHFPHSLGLLYSAFTYYTGFKVNSGEYKVMGLAPYGKPKYAQAHSTTI